MNKMTPHEYQEYNSSLLKKVEWRRFDTLDLTLLLVTVTAAFALTLLTGDLSGVTESANKINSIVPLVPMNYQGR